MPLSWAQILPQCENVNTNSIASEKLVPPAARAPHDAIIFLGAGGAAVSGETACGVVQHKNKIWHTADANMVLEVHMSKQKPQGGCTGWAKQLEASLHHIHTCSGLPGGAQAHKLDPAARNLRMQCNHVRGQHVHE